MDSDTLSTLVRSWLSDLVAVAAAHPSTSILAMLAALVSLVLARSLVIFVIAAFLAIAAIYGSEPVADPLKRWVFSVGCISAILFVSLVVMTLKLRLRDARADLRAAKADRAALLAAYEEESAWRDDRG